jgi:hypothetical protein
LYRVCATLRSGAIPPAAARRGVSGALETKFCQTNRLIERPSDDSIEIVQSGSFFIRNKRIDC